MNTQEVIRDSKDVYDPTRINEIPTSWFNNVDSILDIGSNDGTTLLKSEYASLFKRLDDENKYYGIDVIQFETTQLKNITQEDILKFDTPRRFDCVLCIHVLEHIPLQSWPDLIKKMIGWLNLNGRLILSVPFNEPKSGYVCGHEHESQKHLVFGITEKTFRSMLPGLIFRTTITENRFNGDGAGLLRSHLCWLKRLVMRHPYRRNFGLILIFWQKTEM